MRDGTPLMTEVGPMPYPVMNTLLDDAYGEAPVIRIHQGAPPHLH